MHRESGYGARYFAMLGPRPVAVPGECALQFTCAVQLTGVGLATTNALAIILANETCGENGEDVPSLLGSMPANAIVRLSPRTPKS